MKINIDKLEQYIVIERPFQKVGKAGFSLCPFCGIHTDRYAIKTDGTVVCICMKCGYNYNLSYTDLDVIPIERFKILIKPLQQKPPDVSIIMPTINFLTTMQNCLYSLLKNTAGVEYEIIIIDNGSNDGTIEFLKQIECEKIRVIYNDKNIGAIKANNQGAKISQGKYLAFIHNDLYIINNDWLSKMIKTLNSGYGVTGFVGIKLFADMKTLQFIYLDEPISSIWGACLMLKRDLFFDIGMFDEVFGLAHGDDTDLVYRLREKGNKIKVTPTRIKHFSGVTSEWLQKQFDFYQMAIPNAQILRDRYGAKYTF